MRAWCKETKSYYVKYAEKRKCSRADGHMAKACAKKGTFLRQRAISHLTLWLEWSNTNTIMPKCIRIVWSIHKVNTVGDVGYQCESDNLRFDQNIEIWGAKIPQRGPRQQDVRHKSVHNTLEPASLKQTSFTEQLTTLTQNNTLPPTSRTKTRLKFWPLFTEHILTSTEWHRNCLFHMHLKSS